MLGAELDTVKGWLSSLKEERAAELVAFAATFEADAKAADVAVQARRDADTNNRHFREVGGLAHYLDAVEAARDKVFVALDSRRVNEPKLGLERDWASSFFPGRAPALLTEAQRLACAQGTRRDEGSTARGEGKGQGRET